MDKIINYVVAFLFLSVLAVYGFYLLSIDWNSILPTWSDEYFYYLNGLAAYQFNSTKAALTYNLQGADWLGADAHGFAYPALHAFFAHIIGWHSFNLVLLNLLLLLVSVILVLLQRHFLRAEKLLIILLFLSFPITLQFAVTYLQESLQAFFGLSIGLMFYHLYQQQRGISSNQLVLLLALIFVAGLFRPLWFFWVVLIFAFTKKKHIVLHGSICSFYILFSFIYLKLFTEYVPNYAAHVIALLRLYEIEAFFSSFLNHFWVNIKAYLKDPFSSYKLAYLSIKYLILVFLGLVFFKALLTKRNKQAHLAILGLFVLNFLLLLGLYDAAWWREIRSLSILCYFYLPFLAKEHNPTIRHGITVAVLSCFFLNLAHVRADIQNRQNHRVVSLQNHQKINDFSRFIAKNKDIIYIAYGFIPENDTFELLSMPLMTHQNQRIIYGIPYYRAELKKQADYILIRKNTPFADLRKVFENEFFYLYEVGEGQTSKIINQLIPQ